MACIARILLLGTERNIIQRSNITAMDRHHTSEAESSIATSMLAVANSVSTTGRCGTEAVSPICLEAMYRSGIYYARQFRSSGEQSHFIALEEIKRALTLVNDRWRASGSYLEMLEARILSGIL
jgi:hypothetical protein